MSKVEITFEIDGEGKTSLRIKGIRGKACQPIHKMVSDDLKVIGIGELDATDTPEGREVPTSDTYTSTARVQSGR